MKNGRGLDKTNLVALSTCDWLKLHRNIVVTGPTGSGKTFIACAVAQKACREGFTVHYERASKLFHDLALGKADGRYLKILADIAKKDLLVIDDFALAPLIDEQRRDLLEIFEDRYNRRSTIVVSQVPSDNWHEIIGDPTIADAILDRLIHNAHKIQLRTKVSKRKEEHPDLEF
jgi:DNA replication protein DnaC